MRGYVYFSFDITSCTAFKTNILKKQFDINNKDDFERIVNDVRNGRIPFIGEQYQELYRGQSKDSYVLKPGISRYVKTKEELNILEAEIISDFKKMVNKSPNTTKYIQLTDFDNDFENDWRWIEQIQHFRIPTRLLDWTIDPRIALFFAVESNQTEVGQFWIFKSPLNWSCDEHFEIDPFDKNIDLISNSSFYVEDDYQDKIAEQRMSFQSGKFTFQNSEKSIEPMENQNHLKDKMLKYTINPSSKQNLLDYLLEFNINEDTVYVRYDDEIETLIGELKEKYSLK